MVDIQLYLSKFHSLSPHALPNGYSLRNYQPGDEATWTQIHKDTHYYDPLPVGLFRREFGDDELALRDRQLYVINPDGAAVATATAWFPKADHPQDLGRLHWLAVDPSVQRHGIASALVGAICDRMDALGYTGAYLSTGADNDSAIRLYRRLGFRHRNQDPSDENQSTEH